MNKERDWIKKIQKHCMHTNFILIRNKKYYQFIISYYDYFILYDYFISFDYFVLYDYFVFLLYDLYYDYFILCKIIG